MSKTLIVCEKPSAAVKIASALAAKRPKKRDFNGSPTTSSSAAAGGWWSSRL
jgi:hypothetical protein